MQRNETDRRNAPPIDENEDKFIHKRLRAVYRFALQKIFFEREMKRTDWHLDVGTYKGTFVKELFWFANKVVSFDLDREKLKEAKARQDLKKFYPERLNLAQMKAQNIGLPSNFFDSVTVIEVFGAGFDGTDEDVETVIREVHRTLKPGGMLIMTVRSKSAEEAFGAIGSLDDKGLPAHRHDLKSLLQELFHSDFEWYGQVPMKKNKKGRLREVLENASRFTLRIRENPSNIRRGSVIFQLFEQVDNILFSAVREPHFGVSLPLTLIRDENRIGHPQWDPRGFVPTMINNLDNISPAYWVLVAQKPVEQNTPALSQ